MLFASCVWHMNKKNVIFRCNCHFASLRKIRTEKVIKMSFVDWNVARLLGYVGMLLCVALPGIWWIWNVNDEEPQWMWEWLPYSQFSMPTRKCSFFLVYDTKNISICTAVKLFLISNNTYGVMLYRFCVHSEMVQRTRHIDDWRGQIKETEEDKANTYKPSIITIEFVPHGLGSNPNRSGHEKKASRLPRSKQ